jgi:RNAse (barnase) inhibitor barstar
MQQIANFYSHNGKRVIFLDGKALPTVQDLFQSLSIQLSFPNYFGYNLDSFDEMINDLEWVAELEIDVVIYNEDYLAADNKNYCREILEILRQSSAKNINILFIQF